jgi:hypothetical protein
MYGCGETVYVRTPTISISIINSIIIVLVLVVLLANNN